MHNLISESYKKRIQVLAGISQSSENKLLEEGKLINTLVGMLSIIGGMFSTGNAQNFDDAIKKLKYPKEERKKLVNAMQNPVILDKLVQLGYGDNNIQVAIDKFKSTSKTNIETKKKTINLDALISDDELVKLLKKRFHITQYEVDTLIDIFSQSFPSTIIVYDTLIDTQSQFFEPGKFILSDSARILLRDKLKQIKESGDVLLSATIYSSTDLKPLNKQTAKSVASFPGAYGNEKLSNARACSITKELQQNGINDSLIYINISTAEQRQIDTGEKESYQDSTKRFVRVVFERLQITSGLEDVKGEVKEKYKTSIELMKGYSNKKLKPVKGIRVPLNKRNPPIKKVDVCKFQ